MSYLDDMVFQYYPGKVNIPEPIGYTKLTQFIEAHKNPKPGIRETFNKIADAETSGDMAMKAYLKQNKLFYFSPCVHTNGKGRKYSDITRFTGLTILEFDHIDHSIEFRDLIFDRMKCVVAAYVSPSKRGVKFLVRIPVVTSVEEYKEYYYGLCYYMERFEGFDYCNQNPILPLFLSWDEGIRYRDNPTIWRQKGEKEGEFPTEIDKDFEPVEEVTDAKLKDILFQIRFNIEKADKTGTGHPHVRSAGLIAGGYVGAGYLTREQAEEYLFEFMEASDYLQKNMDTYKKTAQQMLAKGETQPILLDEDKNGRTS